MSTEISANKPFHATRRGFLGLLAGAILGKILGPRVLASVERAPEMARSLESSMASNTYLPLEIFSSRVLEIVHREVKWLRLKQLHQDFNSFGYLPGHTSFVRYPARLSLAPLDTIDHSMEVYPDRIIPVTIDTQINVDLDLNAFDWDRPWSEVDQRYLEPIGRSLAERLIGCVRRHGGAEYLVSVDQHLPTEVPRVVLARYPEAGLSLRAMQLPDQSHLYGRDALRFDMLFGLDSPDARPIP